MPYFTRYRPSAGLLDNREEPSRVRADWPHAGLVPARAGQIPDRTSRSGNEDDLIPPAVLALYREALDADGLDFLTHGPRSLEERLAFAQRVHPQAHRTAEPLPEAEQRRFRERGAIDERSAFLGPDGIVYRRGEDSGEGLAARIRRGFENAVGGYERPNLVDILFEDHSFTHDGSASDPAEAVNGTMFAQRQAQGQQQTTAEKRQPPYLISPVPNGHIRSSDDYGAGAFGARRRKQNGEEYGHQGVDIAASPGARVTSAVTGTVTKIGFPYGDDLSYRYVEITTPDGYAVRHFYVDPDPNLEVGDTVVAGQTEIGSTQDLGRRYDRIINHIHIELRDSKAGGQVVDPTPWLTGIQDP